jgi:(1->4)-alpha-D-glucan 1-alpha-D-glucosylmutase
VVVEKILGPDEPLPEDWPVFGTTGYDFLRALNNLFVEKDNASAFDRIYRSWMGHDVSFPELVYQKKYLTLQVSLSSELQVLATQLDRLSEANRWSRDFTLNSLRRALREIIACFGVYRSYITGRDIQPRDRLYVERAVARAKRHNPAISAALFDFVRDMLLLRYHDASPPEVQAEQRRFVGKFQQLTSPVMAKGLEDTAFYVYNRLLSLNEVGGDPDQFGSGVHPFHRFQLDRRARFPFALSATATHDTKRGEDVRARLNALSEMPQLWRKALSHWRRLNAKHRVRLDDDVVPDRNEEYFIYQTLLGAWPMPGHSSEDFETFVERIQAYVQKALHEAKAHTSWVNPNPPYDAAVSTFVQRILDERQSDRFLNDFRELQKRVSHYGLFNSLAQTLLKITLPGVPDVYQGTELWDFSLVDPDNRRPVDYERRRQLLTELQKATGPAEGSKPSVDLARFARELTDAKEDGRIKLYLIWRALHLRRDHPELFTLGEYLPAHATAERDLNLCAFVRRHNGRLALVAVPRLVSHLVGPTEPPLGPAAWHEAVLFLPGGEPGRRWQNVFTGEVLTAASREGQAALPLAEVFAHFPVALFLAVP